MNRKWMALAAAGCVSLMLTACDLLPVEETFRTAPVISDFQKEAFAMAECARKDLVLSKNITCVYVPVRTENLSFGIGGIPYDEMFAELGDSVKAGQLLGQLRLDGIDASIESARRQLETLNVQRRHLEQDRELALRRQRTAGVGLSAAEQEAALAAVEERYDRQALSIEDSVVVAQLQLEACLSRLAERQLIAPIDGTVTYVRKYSAGDVSVAGDKVMSVADSTMSLFRAETEYWSLYEPGQLVTITANKKEYEATVMSEAQLGLTPTEHIEGKRAYVYMAPNGPSFELEDNDRGSMTLVLDSRENVLCVPADSISTINGETVVYYRDDEGMKAYKAVEVGLQAGKQVEIISGLEEGELVIVG